jgi:uncharacterized Zn-binding protein involved in type VI secretion
VTITVGVNPPKTPVTEGSQDLAPATVPNVCKMPGPPAPFIPTPLPNIGQSSDRLTDGTTTVKIDGHKVAIKGSYYMSQPSPDVASQGTGGGIVSAAVQGKTEFVAPGSMNVKLEGKNTQLLGDAMTNNGGSPANALCAPGNQQLPRPLTPVEDALCEMACECNKIPPKPGQTCTRLGEEKHKCCDDKIKSSTPPPALGGEQGYHPDGKPISGPRVPPNIPEGSVWPDACSLDAAGKPDQFFDFKFGCPPGQPVRQHTFARLEAAGIPGPHVTLLKQPPQVHPDWSRGQKKKVMDLGENLDPEVNKEPEIISPATCNC